jgi:hypothetical protein
VGETVVWRWRKALGVGRADPPGSQQLIQAAAEEEFEARRNALELNLGRHLHQGSHGPRWTPGEVALLGTMPDEEVAAQIGKTPSAVRQKREGLGIANPAANRWTAENLALLGTLPDGEVARLAGRSRTAVTQKRCQLGIANPFDRRRRTYPLHRPQRRPWPAGPTPT